jgi:tRNA dimethylallyltransferase
LALLEFSQAHPEVLVGGIDFRNPDEEVSVYLYQQEVFRWVQVHGEEIIKTGGLILHGGTGLYLDAILEGKSLLAPRDEALRARLEQLSVPELQNEATKVASEAYKKLNESDQLNPRRLVRVVENALNVNVTNGKDEVWDSENVQKVFAQSKKVWQINIPPRDVLWPIINARVFKYYEEGWLDEVEGLLWQYGATAPALCMMGYRQLVEFILANENWRELVQNNDNRFQLVTQGIQLAHRQYAKRQETWARKYR